MMFLLASILMRLERLLKPFCKPFDALARMKSARIAIIFIVSSSPFVSRKRIPSSQKHRVSAPAYARCLS
jgi:hypothetical protein